MFHAVHEMENEIGHDHNHSGGEDHHDVHHDTDCNCETGFAILIAAVVGDLLVEGLVEGGLEMVDSDTREQAQAAGARQQQDRRPPPSAMGGAPDKITETIHVPSEAVGMIIGKGGETIKQMQYDTGCKINVQQASGRDIDRPIELVGEHGAIERAKVALWDKVEQVVSSISILLLILAANFPHRERRTVEVEEEVEAVHHVMTSSNMVATRMANNRHMLSKVHPHKLLLTLTHTLNMVATRHIPTCGLSICKARLPTEAHNSLGHSKRIDLIVFYLLST